MGSQTIITAIICDNEKAPYFLEWEQLEHMQSNPPLTTKASNLVFYAQSTITVISGWDNNKNQRKNILGFA